MLPVEIASRIISIEERLEILTELTQVLTKGFQEQMVFNLEIQKVIKGKIIKL